MDTTSIIVIDRTQPFDLVKFLGKGWLSKGWRVVEEDRHSLGLTELDLAKVQIVTMLQDGEKYVKGKEHMRRLKRADHIRLDAKVFQTLWENPELIPESWKERINGKTRYIHFPGTELLRPDDGRCVLSLYWNGGQWSWSCSYWLESPWNVPYPSAVLASPVRGNTSNGASI